MQYVSRPVQVFHHTQMQIRNWVQWKHNVFIRQLVDLERMREIVIKIGWWVIVASYKKLDRIGTERILREWMKFVFVSCVNDFQFLCRLFPNDSHGLCPQFYNFAFKYHFPAVKKHKTCIEPTYSRDAKKWPHNGYIRMGYFQRIDAFDRKLNEKNFYAITTRHEPFTPYHPDRLK